MEYRNNINNFDKMLDKVISDSDVLNEITSWIEDKTEYEILTNPVLKELLDILYKREV
tara:strand:+ start:108 stop:281 length:174 start_codon:yes stop_codon:yes gene_type:complete